MSQGWGWGVGGQRGRGGWESCLPQRTWGPAGGTRKEEGSRDWDEAELALGVCPQPASRAP